MDKMDKFTFVKKCSIWTAIISYVVCAIVFVINVLIKGNMVEETLFGEAAKYFVMTGFVVLILLTFGFVIFQSRYDVIVKKKEKK